MYHVFTFFLFRLSMVPTTSSSFKWPLNEYDKQILEGPVEDTPVCTWMEIVAV